MARKLKYPYIRAHGASIGSNAEFISEEVKRATRLKLPEDVISIGYDGTHYTRIGNVAERNADYAEHLHKWVDEHAGGRLEPSHP